ncbi:sialin, putative [Pediculus humanus corporis]|uniref:Sialin, putative n=1 Tax=Pediculus humanus subsp. corporis TaxID=121224 RepID=E0V965_PEDHC|nr:sialin, putative [Pediculus humanus corporis]EEB09921.1 sialin, putative [Pediculus humanus corporis]
MGISVFIAGFVNLLLPIACKYHYLLASMIRAVQGLALGVTWPVMHWLSARWIPQTERSKFMTSYHGAAIGTAITYPLSGIIITHYGWEFVFYFIGIITLIWCVAWCLLVYDSPNEHPRLTDKESKYLKEKIGNVVTLDKRKVTKTPWREILTSKPFWAVLMASHALMWGTITLSMQTPTYFYEVHQLDIKSTGFVSGIPEVSKFLFALVFSTAIDKSIAKKKLKMTTARKLAVVVSEFFPANLLVILGFLGSSNKILATILLSGISLLGGASTSGSLANVVDLSPNHAGILLGIIKTLTIIPGVVSPLFVNYLRGDHMLDGGDKSEQWKNVFLLLAIIFIFCSSLYVIMGSGEVQYWNDLDKKETEEVVFLEECKTIQGQEMEKNI